MICISAFCLKVEDLGRHNEMGSQQSSKIHIQKDRARTIGSLWPIRDFILMKMDGICRKEDPSSRIKNTQVLMARLAAIKKNDLSGR